MTDLKSWVESHSSSLDAQALLQTVYADTSGLLAPVIWSFRGTSCFGATLASTPVLVDKQATNASLILLDTAGLEIALTSSTGLTTQSVVGRCDAGVSRNNCSIVAASLDPTDRYYLVLLYLGEPSITKSNATRSAVRLDAAFSAYDIGNGLSLLKCLMACSCGSPAPSLA